MAIQGAWLAMDSVTEAAAYQQYAPIITHAYPINGGEWNTSGELVQRDGRINWEWPQALPALAKQAGHVYAPVIGCPEATAFLDNPAVWNTAIDNLLATAFGKFDSPWDAVMFDIEGPRSPYQDKINAFYGLVCPALQAVGLEVYGWFWNCLEPHEYPMCDEAIDWGVFGGLFDKVHVGEAFHANFTPWTEYSIAPVWWIEEGMQRMIYEGVPANKIVMDLRLAARHGYGPTANDVDWIDYDDAVVLLSDAGATLEWVDHFPEGAAHPESMLPGSVKEWMADLPDDTRLWVEDYRTTTIRLALARKYGIESCAVFRPTLSNPTSWQAIADWKRPAPREQRPTDRFYQAPNWCG